MSTSHAVVVEEYAERHYISKFKKKYKGAWSATWKAIVEEFKRIDTLIGINSIVEIICDVGDIKICKTEFRVAGTQESRHGSGNRCIIAIHKSTQTVKVLLVYHKGYLGSTNETASWKALIKENYSEYCDVL